MMTYKEMRFVRRNGELIQQERMVTSTTKTPKWWKPWLSTVEYVRHPWVDVPILNIDEIKRGDRVEVLMTAGFHKGALGTVEYVAPDDKVWVLRDNAGSAVYYHRDELEVVWRSPKSE